MESCFTLCNSLSINALSPLLSAVKIIPNILVSLRFRHRTDFALCCLTAVAALLLLSGTAAESASPGAASGLAHVALRMTDTEKALAFYRDFLGLPERFRTNKVPGQPNVYYRKDGSPADLAKQKQGELMLVDLRIGADQSLELFAGGSEEQPVLHHPALTTPDLAATRQQLAAPAAVVPPPAKSDNGPLKSFFTRDPGGTEIEITGPREGPPAKPSTVSELGARLESIVCPCAAEPALVSRFFSGGLGMAVTTASGGITATATNGDRLEVKTDGNAPPTLVFAVADLEAARQFLQSRPNRASYEGAVGIREADGHAFIELLAPDDVRIHIAQKP